MKGRFWAAVTAAFVVFDLIDRRRLAQMCPGHSEGKSMPDVVDPLLAFAKEANEGA